MKPFMTYAEQHTVGVVLVATALASLLLWFAYCLLVGRGEPHQRPRDVVDMDEAARRSGFLTVHIEPDTTEFDEAIARLQQHADGIAQHRAKDGA